MTSEVCLQKIIPTNTKLLYVEVGVLRATNIIALAEAYPLLDIIGIDSYEAYVDSAHNYKVSKTLSAYNRLVAEQKINCSKHKHRITLLVEDSHNAARNIADESIDIVFLDKNLSFEGAQQDVLTWYPKIKTGGVLCGHDAYTDEILRGVKLALNTFKINKIAVVDNEVWFIKKENT
jgi:hypothetical protein